MVIFFRAILTLAALSIASSCATESFAQSNKSTNGAALQKYQLRYDLKPGEKLVSKVVHFAETRTVMSNLEEESSSRTTSEKVWEVLSADGDEMTFVYKINSVSLAQTVGDGEELSYDSQSDTSVPDVFKAVAETISKPLATITINSRGQVVKRDKDLQAPQLGIGELTIPLPEEAVAIGAQWNVPRELRVKLDSGAFKTVKVRELYTLEKVSAGVATLSLITQPLTPVNDAAVEAQLIQQLSAGEIKFDLDRGRLISKTLDWSDEVLGFRGAETSLRYDAKFTEELLPESSRTASRNTPATK